MGIPTEEMRNHWWWRPGWRVGRSFYTWHITFSDHPLVHELSRHYSPLIAKFATLDPVAISGLHLTLQGIGFTDEVSRSDIEEIAAIAQARCAQLEPLEVVAGPLDMDAEGVYLPVRPAGPITDLRKVMRQSIVDVWGQENVPESLDGFHPHITLAYSNSSRSAKEIRDALNADNTASASIKISDVYLIDLNRDAKRYDWADVLKVHIGR